ncbi:hypothetical protein AMECASPLE_024830 [Ameca splendens]|uniref:Uncharacterized protein n=1 Tax=Ameca splendens TaxID=208324 RepID=A0ABV1ABC1_9TELE
MNQHLQHKPSAWRHQSAAGSDRSNEELMLLLLALNPPLCSWVLDLLLTTAGSDPLQSNRWHHAASSLRGRVQSPVIVL